MVNEIFLFLVVLESDDDNEEVGVLDESTENTNHELANNDLSNGKTTQEMENSCSNGSVDCSSSKVSLKKCSDRPHLTSTPVNTEKRPELNKSVLLHKSNRSNDSVTKKRSNEMIDENGCDRSSSSKHTNRTTPEASQ
jgi:hypothetical protein